LALATGSASPNLTPIAGHLAARIAALRQGFVTAAARRGIGDIADMAIAIDSRQARRSGLVPPVNLVRVAQRARAFRAAQRHSLLVRLLRFLLPLAAVGILGGYVGLVALKSSLLPKIKIEDITITPDDLTMKNPSYFDTTSDGRYEVRAKQAIVSFVQKKETPIKLVDVSGEMVKKSGEITRLKAKHGLFDNAKGELELLDGIEIDGSNGVMARLTRAMIYSKEGKVVSTDPVSANMPAGSIQAGSMTMGTKTKLVHFRGGVSVRLIPQQGQTLGAGKDARQPVDIRAEELDVDDAAKTAHFRGKVVAIQGETMLQTPSLKIKYEGKAAAALEGQTGKEAGKETAKQGGTRVTFMWAREGVDITAGNDRRIVADLADFDVTAETALFDGNVTATQEKNTLKGGRLSIDKKGGKTRLETPGGGRILANFVPPASAAQKPAKRLNPVETAQASLMGGGFKADRTAPMTVDAALLEIFDSANKAVFSGNVAAEQGDMKLRTSELTAFFSGKAGLGLSDAGDTSGTPPTAGAKGKGKEKSEIVRMEARQGVLITSPDQSASSKWADFDVKANTALLGGGVTMDKEVPDPADATKKKLNVVTGERLRLDLTTGVYQVETDPTTTPPVSAVVPKAGAGDGKTATKGPATSSSGPTTAGTALEEKAKSCGAGRICGVFYPGQIKQKAMDAAKKKAPKDDGN
jgi:lipopolysaccharide export system protein LptA